MERKRPLCVQAERITDIYIVWMLLVFPLFPGFRGYSAIAQAKFYFYLISTALWLLGLSVLGLRGLPRRRGLPLSAAALGAFLLWCVFSAALSPYGFAAALRGAGWYNGLFTLTLYILTAFFVSRFARPKPIHVRALGISVTVCCLLALRQLAGGNPLRLYPHGWRFADAGVRYTGMYLGTVGNTLILASVLSLAVPWLTVTAVRKRGRDLLLLIPAGLALWILWRSDASSAAVALLGSTALMLPRFFPAERRKRLYAGEGLLLLLALLALWYYPGGSGTLYEAARLLRGEAADTFGSGRIRIWRSVWELIKKRPLLGGGPGTLPLRLDVAFSRYVPETGETLSSFVSNAHNEYLGYAADTGGPGLLLYLGAMAATFFARGRREDGLLCLWGAVSYWIQGFFALGLCLSAPLLWILWGLCMSGERDVILPPDSPSIPPDW